VDTLRKIDEAKPIKVERLENALKVSVNITALSDNFEDRKQKGREELINHVLLLFALERESFGHFFYDRLSLFNFIKTYRRVFEAKCSNEKINNYVNNILGEEHINSFINVFIKENKYSDKLIFCEISHKKGFILKQDKKYSEAEILKLIKSKDIVVRYSTHHTDKQEHFFCAIEECLDLNDDRIISFTMDNYPFIYEDLRSSLDTSTINKGRVDFRNNRELVLIDILNYFNKVKKTNGNNSYNADCLAKRCISSLKRLNNPN
jgi:hypothetical protein